MPHQQDLALTGLRQVLRLFLEILNLGGAFLWIVSVGNGRKILLRTRRQSVRIAFEVAPGTGRIADLYQRTGRLRLLCFGSATGGRRGGDFLAIAVE